MKLRKLKIVMFLKCIILITVHIVLTITLKVNYYYQTRKSEIQRHNLLRTIPKQVT